MHRAMGKILGADPRLMMHGLQGEGKVDSLLLLLPPRGYDGYNESGKRRASTLHGAVVDAERIQSVLAASRDTAGGVAHRHSL